MMNQVRREVEKERDKRIKSLRDHMDRVEASFECCMKERDLHLHFAKKLEELILNHKDAMEEIPVKMFPREYTLTGYIQHLSAFRDMMMAMLDLFVKDVSPQKMKDMIVGHLRTETEKRIKGLILSAEQAIQSSTDVGEALGLMGGDSDAHTIQ